MPLSRAALAAALFISNTLLLYTPNLAIKWCIHPNTLSLPPQALLVVVLV